MLDTPNFPKYSKRFSKKTSKTLSNPKKLGTLAHYPVYYPKFSLKIPKILNLPRISIIPTSNFHKLCSDLSQMLTNDPKFHHNF